MSDVPVPSEASANEDDFDSAYAKRRRGCIFRIIAAWMLLGLIIVLAVIYVRRSVERDPEAIERYMADRFELNLPEVFKPYSMNRFIDTNTVAYWDFEHTRESGQSYAMISFFWVDEWQEQPKEEIIERRVAQFEDDLARNEIQPENKVIETIEVNEKPTKVYCYTGQVNVDDALMPGAACFMFVETWEGLIQVHTLGVDTYLNKDAQIDLMRSVNPLKKKRGSRQ